MFSVQVVAGLAAKDAVARLVPMILSDNRGSSIFGVVGDCEAEVEVEFTQDACGYSTSDDRAEPVSKCISVR